MAFLVFAAKDSSGAVSFRTARSKEDFAQRLPRSKTFRSWRRDCEFEPQRGHIAVFEKALYINFSCSVAGLW